MKYIPVGIDIAKHLMPVHCSDEHTGEVIDKQIKCNALLKYFRYLTGNLTFANSMSLM